MAILAGSVFFTGAGNSPAGAQSESQAVAAIGAVAAIRAVAATGAAPPTKAVVPIKAVAPFGAVASTEETAFAVPRLPQPDSDAEVALPQPLTPSEAARIADIYKLQAHGTIAAAEHETAQLDTGRALGQAMLGHVLADRYLSRFTKPGPDELRSWLVRWPELADAPNVRALLLQRSPKAERRAKASDDLAPDLAPSASASLTAPKAAGDVGDADDGPPDLDRSAELDQSVWAAARRRGGNGVRRLLARTNGLSGRYRSQLLGEAGRILFAMGNDAAAYDLAASGVGVCRRARPLESCAASAAAGFSAGLAAWRMGRVDLARPMFEAAWQARLTTTGQRAGSALWAARTALRTGDFDGQASWLARAAQENGTFYGLLARRMLQLSRAATRPGGSDRQDTLSLADVDAVAATAAGTQAFALLQVGQRARAEAELRRLWPEMQATPALQRAVMLVADRAQLYELAAQLDEVIQDAEGQNSQDQNSPGQYRRNAWFRIPNLRPDGGFRIDPALVFGLVRTESNFDNSSVSSVGASGIMQLMPETANFIVDGSADGQGHGKPVSDTRLREMLADPSRNLALGQRYVVYLAGHALVNGSLVHLLASYNCGPARMAQWVGGLRDLNDPLLFMEAIPIDETRNFVSRVLTYTWQYAGRLRLPTPSLDELAVGAWPRYHPLPAHYDISARLR